MDATHHAAYRDERWLVQINRAAEIGFDEEFVDLVPFLKANTVAPTQIFYAQHHRIDRLHAERLDLFASVTLVPRPSDNHNVVRDMRDSGELEQALLSAFD